MAEDEGGPRFSFKECGRCMFEDAAVGFAGGAMVSLWLGGADLGAATALSTGLGAVFGAGRYMLSYF